ncbi:MAG: hypothetical protein HQ526_07955 [Actinobacteria bacterium]|nr:hypothetical protein [Actinomycetota bacterium]
MPAIVSIAQGVFRIPTAGDFINTVVFAREDGSVTLVDCGIKSDENARETVRGFLRRKEAWQPVELVARSNGD